MEIQKSLFEEWEKACKQFQSRFEKAGIGPVPVPALEVSGKKVRKMGICYYPGGRYRNGRIQVFAYVVSAWNEEEMLNTIKHEVAHIIAYYFGSKGHDKIWKNVFIAIGGSGNRFASSKPLHPDNMRSYKIRKILYKCNCMSHEITIRTHNKIKKGFKYQCRICGGKIREV
jgi:predicted SprT family Zn-dependent metalloprotease